MIYITLNQTSSGRSGHKLKDIMSMFIISYFVEGSQVVYHESWNKQSILKYIDVSILNTASYDLVIKKKRIAWNGISQEDFFSVVNEIKSYDSNGKKVLFVFSGAHRFHPFQLHNLYTKGIIKHDFFTQTFLPTLNRFFFGYNTQQFYKNCISIHIRRGDIFKRIINGGQDVKYFKRIIDILNKHINIPIHIYSEYLNSSDLLILKKELNVSLYLGNTSSLHRDFYNMVTSKYLFISSGGFSTWSSYISIGKVFYNPLYTYQFNHLKDPINMFRFNLDNLESTIKSAKY
jgi:flavodoxin